MQNSTINETFLREIIASYLYLKFYEDRVTDIHLLWIPIVFGNDIYYRSISLIFRDNDNRSIFISIRILLLFRSIMQVRYYDNYLIIQKKEYKNIKKKNEDLWRLQSFYDCQSSV